LLALGTPTSDICRTLGRKWRVKAKTVAAHVQIARRLHTDFISTLGDADAQGDSAAYWRRWLVQCEQTVAELPAIRAQLRAESNRLVAAAGTLRGLIPGGILPVVDFTPAQAQQLVVGIAHHLEGVERLAVDVGEIAGQLDYIQTRARSAAWAVRDRLDKITGAYAPVRHAAALDAKVEHGGIITQQVEPNTKEEAADELRRLFGGRITQMLTPLEN
jgi:hypothetical protein